MGSLEYTPNGRDGFTCRLESPFGHVLIVASTLEATVPEVKGDKPLIDNPAIVERVWAYGKNENARRQLRKAEAKEVHRKTADAMKKSSIALAALAEKLSGEEVAGRWCSGCFTKTRHRKVKVSSGAPTFLCFNCGAPTTPCAVPRCANFANRGTGTSVPRYCAEHRHDIPSFEKLDAKLKVITDYEQWLTYEKRNAAKATKVIAATLLASVVVAPVALVAAPAIGGALGAMTGLTGAAATSHGLAMLGGGALAAGGLGMAGGTAVVTAVGGALGGVLGATVASAYVGSDKSFRIVCLREGSGTPVILANGFMTETTNGWGGWRRLIDDRYPHAPVYRVYWGAKELKDISALLGLGASKQATVQAGKVLAARSSKLAKLPGLAGLLAAGDVAANPWTVARTRASMTGAILADLIARTETERFVLVGHSLGARVMATAAEALGTKTGSPRIEAMHLLGGAFGRQHGSYGLGDSVSDCIWNYHSRRDPVLKFLYRAAEFGQAPAGLDGLMSTHPRIRNVNVATKVGGHSDYFGRIDLAK